MIAYHTALHIKPQRLGSSSLSRQFVTPYYKFSAGNTSRPKLDVGTFGPNQYNPRVLLAHQPNQTHNITNLLVGVYSKHRHKVFDFRIQSLKYFCTKFGNLECKVLIAKFPS